VRSPIYQCPSYIWLWSHFKLHHAPGRVKIGSRCLPGTNASLWV